MTQSRPFGVSLIAILLLVETIVALGIAALVLLSPGHSAWLSTILDRTGLPVAMSSLLAVPPLLTAALAGFVFRGLWEQREWARVAAIIMTFLLSAAAVVSTALLFALDASLSTKHIYAIIALVSAVAAFLYLLNIRFESRTLPATYKRPAPDEPETARPAQPAPPPLTPIASPQPAFSESQPALIPPPPRRQAERQPQSASATTATDAIDNTLVIQDATRKSGARRLPVAWVVVRQGPDQGQTYQLYADQPLTMGRNPAHTNPPLTDPTVSGSHAQLRYEQGRCVIYDLDSTNGTFIGESAVQRFPLLDGDEIRLGSTVLQFTTSPPP
ncbi:MAG TPA: FHA domain-containing protein [Caldilineae bacterium]|nr:FHA domain-containing protein [Caldilineae bacterium]